MKKYCISQIGLPLIVLLLCLLMIQPGLAQERTASLKGMVFSETNQLLKGASVELTIGKKTYKALTNDKAEFEFVNLPVNSQVSIAVTFIGYEKNVVQTTLKPGDVNSIIVKMAASAVELDKVIVTALGVTRNKSSLGYSAEKMKGEEVTDAKEPNFINALHGKIAGVQVTSSSGSVGSSSRIVIRGENSLRGSQPLFIVDGVPIDNSNNKSASDFRVDAGGVRHAVDFGNAAADINPDDIESLTVLKGPNAASLYGSRAANGVVMIVTKSGKGKQRSGVSLNYGMSAERPVRLPDYQDEYGQGLNFKYAYKDGNGGGVNDWEDKSWGPRLDSGYLTPQFFSAGKAVPWVSDPDNISRFFETGITHNGGLSFFGNSDKQDYRFSYNLLQQKGMVPNTDFKRHSFSINAGTLVGEKLRVRTYISYIRSESDNRMSGGYDDNNVMKQFLWSGRQVDFTALKNYRNPDRTIYNWISRHNNPYFILNENTNAQEKDHLIGNLSLEYPLLSWLSVSGKTGIDFYQDGRALKRAQGTIDYVDGMYQEDVYRQRESNYSLQFDAHHTLDNFWKLSLIGGGNIMTREFRTNSAQAPKLLIPGVYNLSNANAALIASNYLERKRINSLFASADIGVSKYGNINLSLRNDWSSTLPAKNNAYMYPATSISSNLVNYFILPDFISFLKLRGSIAQAGVDAPVYYIDQPYGTVFWNSSVSLSVANTMYNNKLKPERTTAYETGLDLGLFRDRIQLEATYYRRITRDQILSVSGAPSSGYAARIINAGRIANKGLELILNAAVLKSSNGLNWNILATFNRNTNRVEELVPGVDVVSLGSSRQNELFGATIMAKKGEAIGTIYGRKFARDPNGNIIHDAGGLPTLEPTASPIGNYTPDWIGGITNQLSYKRFTFSFTLDMKQGGDIVSGMQSVGMRAGVLEESLPGRSTGIIGTGVIKNADGSFKANDVRVAAMTYYQSYYNSNAAEAMLMDAGFIKLREAKFGWRWIPAPGKIRFVRDVHFSLVGRNLLILKSSTRHFDPETSLASDYIQGLEFGQVSPARSIGFNININF